MKKNKIIILLSVLVAFIVAAVLAKVITKHVDKINKTDEIIVEFTQDDLTEVYWTLDDESLKFVKTDGVWQDPEDDNFPVNQEAMEEFLSDFESIHASFIIEDIANWSDYGLKNPEGSITFVSGEEEQTLYFGGYSTMDSKRYVCTNDEVAYLIDEDLMESLVTDRDEFILNDSVPTLSQITKVTLAGDNEVSFVYDPDGVYSYTDEYNYYLLKGTSYLMLSDTNVSEFFTKLNVLSYTNYATYEASQSDLSQFGLDDPELTLTVEGVDEDDNSQSYVLEFGCKIIPAEEEDEEDTKDCYFRVKDSEMIYTVSESVYDSIVNAGYDTLRPQEVVSLNWDEVTDVTIVSDNESHTITFSEEDEEIIATLDGETEIEFSEIETAIDELSVSEFSDADIHKDLELNLVIGLDNETYPSLTINIYQNDGDTCVLSLNGETLGYIPRSQMITIREAMNTIILNLD